MLYAKRRDSCFAQSVAQGLVVWQLYKKQVGLCTVIASFCFYRGSFFRRRLLDNSAPKLNNQDGQADYKERRLKGSENILIKGWGGGSWFWLRQVSSGTGAGVQMQASLSYHWGDLFFFDLHGKDLQHVLGEERTRLPWRGWAWLPWRSWTRLLWRWTTTRSWASPWGLVPEEREEGSRSPGRKNFLGCAGPKITREIITKTIMIKSTICSPRVTFGLSRLAPLDRLGCGWPRPAESPLLCLFNAGPAWEWYISYKH